MKAQNRSTGNFGENLAAEALIKKGYQILARNFSNKFGEIDIIAQDKNIIVFAEVKTKTSILYGAPEDMVGKNKLARVRQMATIYLQGKSIPCRIDVVAIVLNPDKSVSRLTHYENVY